MFKNIFKSTIRNLFRNRLFTILNITGLSIGMAAFLLIAQFVVWEKSYDRFFENANDIYRVNFSYYATPNDLRLNSATTFPKVAPMMKVEYPEVINSCRISSKVDGMISIGDKLFEESNMFFADQSVMDVFSFDLISGNRTTCLIDVNTAVIEEKTAKKYFGDNNPIGKNLIVKSADGEENIVITGVVKSRKNSHFQFNLLFSFKNNEVRMNRGSLDNNWSLYDYFTYLKLTPNSNPAALEAKFPNFVNKYGTERLNSEHVKFNLQAMTDIHLHSNRLYELDENGSIELVNFLIIIALFIIGIAWINYINLATATSLKRSKEVGIRKTLGSGNASLKTQFLFESLLINGVSLIIGLTIFIALFSTLETVTDRTMDNILFTKKEFWIFILFVWIFGAALSGFYPAIVLSSANPLKALKQESTDRSNKFSVRNILVSSQFLISSILIAGTIVVITQINFMTDQELGINVENTVAIEIPNYLGDNDRYWQLLKNYKQDLVKLNEVQSVAISSEVPGDVVRWTGGCRPVQSRSDVDQSITISKLSMDKDYLSMYQNKFLAGRNFEKPSDTIYTIINKTAMLLMGFNSVEEAINSDIRLAGIDTLKILGIVDDFHQTSLAKSIVPTAYLFIDWERKMISIKLEKKATKAFLENAEIAFEKYFSGTPFLHHEVENNIMDSYKNEHDLLRLIMLFSGLAIFIAILGLIGLIVFYIEKKKKEISIRKVLGSSTQNLYGLLTKNIIMQVVIANIIAAPIIYYFANQWLDDFAFRQDFPWITLPVAIGATLLISLSSISNLIWKVSRENPVKHLRNE